LHGLPDEIPRSLGDTHERYKQKGCESEKPSPEHQGPPV